MPKLVLLFAASLGLAAVGATPADAGGARLSISLHAEVPGICLVGPGRNALTVAVAIPVGADGAVSTAPQTVVVPRALCNEPGAISVRSALGAAMISGNANGANGKIDYVATATFGGASASLATANPGTGGTAATARAAIGQLVVSIQPVPPPGPMPPSSVYTDTLTVALLPK